MENTDPQHQEDSSQSKKPVEHDYPAHEQDPGPSPQAVNEENNKGAGPAMKWAIPIAIVVLFIIYWFFIRR